MRDIIVTANEEGQRFDKFLKKYFKEAGSGFLYKMLRKKNIVLNGKKAAGNEKLASGDTISIYMSDETIEKFRGEGCCSTADAGNLINIKTDAVTGHSYIEYENYHIDILYEDEYLIFFNKPAGILSQKAKKDDISMAEILEAYLRMTGQMPDGSVQKPGICSRLDRNTSGVMACGKNLKGLQALTEAIREHRVSKYYRCIVEGIPENEGVLSGCLIKDDTYNKVYILEDEGTQGELPDAKKKYVRTEFKVIETYTDKALLEVKLVTGRTHQIRAHLAHTGHPVAGDIKYGAAPDPALKHYLLHAYELKFSAASGALVGVSQKTIRAPLPKEYLRYASKGIPKKRYTKKRHTQSITMSEE